MTDSQVESVCRAICVAEGVDPDREATGLGYSMPKGITYPLWKAREKAARAAIVVLLGEEE